MLCADDAPRHTSAATTPGLRRLWARVANAALRRGDDEGSAIRQANAVVAERKRRASQAWHPAKRPVRVI
jgi:hypothetical protein